MNIYNDIVTRSPGVKAIAQFDAQLGMNSHTQVTTIESNHGYNHDPSTIPSGELPYYRK